MLTLAGFSPEEMELLNEAIAEARAEGFKSGQEAMRERAANRVPSASPYWGIAQDIRLLPVEEAPAS